MGGGSILAFGVVDTKHVSSRHTPENFVKLIKIETDTRHEITRKLKRFVSKSKGCRVVKSTKVN